jgi:hypothetical protein
MMSDRLRSVVILMRYINEARGADPEIENHNSGSLEKQEVCQAYRVPFASKAS